MLWTQPKMMRREETVEEFLKRGGHIERIEAHPDPEGRVILRGHRGCAPKLDGHYEAGVARTMI